MNKTAAIALCLSVLAVLAPASLRAQTPPPLPAPAPVPPPLPAAAQYYYNDNGKQAGPFSADEIKQKMAAGIITPDTLVWKSGTPSWVAAKTLPEFASAGGSGSGGLVAEAGCKGAEIVSDDFSQTDPDEYRTPEDGKLKLKTLAGELRWYGYQNPVPGDADICVTVQIPHNFKEKGIAGGVLFGGNDAGEFYAFVISPTGNGGVVHVANGTVDTPMGSPQTAKGLNPAPGAKNRVRVSVRGNSATFFVNNQQFPATFNGLSNGTGKIGIIASSEAGKRDSWKFANFRATGPS